MIDSRKRTYSIVVDYFDKETKERHHIFESSLSFEDARSTGRQFQKGENFMVRGVIIRPTDFIIKAFHVYDENRKDITRKFVPSIRKKEAIFKKSLEEAKLLTKGVFIVHGRDYKPMKELKAMLETFGLNSIILHEQPSGSRTIVEKLEKYSDVGYAFAILTPDDVGCLDARVSNSLKSVVETLNFLIEAYTVIKQKGPLKKARSELSRVINLFKPRARQNVVLEFGYFIGLLGRDRVCCLHKGDVELPSNMHGIVYIPFKESVNDVRDDIIKELEAVGYNIKI